MNQYYAGIITMTLHSYRQVVGLLILSPRPLRHSVRLYIANWPTVFFFANNQRTGLGVHGDYEI